MFRTNMSPSIPWGPYLVWAQWEFWMVHHCPLGPENYIYVYEVNFLMISFIKYSTYYIELIITNIKWNAALIGLLCVRVENFQSIILIQSDGQPDILLSSQWRNREECIKYKYTRSLGALRAPTSSLRPFGPALGLLDFVHRALRALSPCDTLSEC